MHNDHCSGVTLIELLISLALSSLLLLSVLQLLGHSQDSYRQQTTQIKQLQSERFLAQRFAQEVHTAGTLGCSTMQQTQWHNQLAGALPFSFTALQGYVVNNAPNLPDVLKKNALANSQALQINYLDLPYAQLTTPMTTLSSAIHVSSTKPFSKNDVVVITDCLSTDIFSINSIGNRYGTLSHVELSKSYAPPATVGKITHLLFYVRKASNSKTHSGLYVEQNNYSSEWVSDVDNLNFEFQLAANTPWVKLSSVKNWAEVTAVKMQVTYHNGAEQMIVASVRN